MDGSDAMSQRGKGVKKKATGRLNHSPDLGFPPIGQQLEARKDHRRKRSSLLVAKKKKQMVAATPPQRTERRQNIIVHDISPLSGTNTPCPLGTFVWPLACGPYTGHFAPFSGSQPPISKGSSLPLTVVSTILGGL